MSNELVAESSRGIIIPDFSAEDYQEGTAPFEWLYQFRANPFQMKQLCNKMSARAMEIARMRNFVALFGDYCKTMKHLSGDTTDGGNQTDFQGQSMALWCGTWEATENGIVNVNRFGETIEACSHPIYPLRLLTNIDTGLEKVEMHWRRGNDAERSFIFPKSTIANASSIVKLADYGVAVNSENAKYLVKFLHDVESLNYDRLERACSVGRLGWIDGYGFSPYIDNLVFDGEDAFADRFQSVQEHGSYDEWMTAIKSFREKEHPIIRIVFAASLASALVKPAGIMPFVVHLWGSGGTGKTVVMMVAASIWGNPEIGRYIKSFNSTGVGKELGAVFLNSMPLMLDELQIVSGGKEKLRQLVYELTEGVGRERGRKEGGLQKSGTWRNTTIMTGEEPIVDANWTEGAKYRTIEIKCSKVRFFENGNCVGHNAKEVVGFILKHYGFFGKEFIEKLEAEGLDCFKELHDKFTEEIRQSGDIDSKQALSAALILVADTLAEKWIFHDGITLTVKDILPYLITRREADQDKKAYDYLNEAAAINRIHFSPEKAADKNIEIWGEYKTTKRGDEYIVFYPSKFNEILQNAGYIPGKFVEWAVENEKLRIARDGKPTVTARITGSDEMHRCYWLLVEKNPDGGEPEDEELVEMDELPF